MSLEHKIELAFDDMTAPPELKWSTLEAIEARRAMIEDAESAGMSKAMEDTAHPTPPKTRSQRPPRTRSAWWKYALPVAACFILAVVGVLGIGNMKSEQSAQEGPAMSAEQSEQSSQAASVTSTLLEQAVAYVGIDVNPSLELTLGEQDTVLSAEAENADAEKVLAGLDLTGLSYDQALVTLFASEGMVPYLVDDAIVEISVTTDDQALAQTLVIQSDQALAQLPCRGTSRCVDDATRVAAHEAGMGVGKYRAATELVELDPAYTLDECSHMTMRQLHDALDHHSAQGAPSAATQTEAQGQSSGQGARSSGYGHHFEGHNSTHH